MAIKKLKLFEKNNQLELAIALRQYAPIDNEATLHTGLRCD